VAASGAARRLPLPTPVVAITTMDKADPVVFLNLAAWAKSSLQEPAHATS
jgi:hypothetical protein